MGLLAKIFGSDSVIDNSMKAIDKVFYTDEEKAENKANLLKLYEPFKLAQRLLALTFAIPFVSVFSICAIGYMLGVPKETAETIIQWNVDTLGEPVFWIMVFYFAGGATEGFIGKMKAKK
ncbi:hypothetical protein [Vibrio litoralis]|uniref:hypothetical protein n=1 Tax=Vibrio litoralis TaxID=335972 RepID=UPI000422CB6E|nr:hypothetical protein [Vibrio litoralis]